MRYKEALKQSNFLTVPNTYGIYCYWITKNGLDYAVRKQHDEYVFHSGMLLSALNCGMLDRDDWMPFDPPEKLKRMCERLDEKLYIELPGAKNE